MKKRRWAIVGIIASLTIALGGCVNQEAIDALMQSGRQTGTEGESVASPTSKQSLLPGETPKPEPKYAVAFSQAASESAWEKASINNIQAAAAAGHVRLLYADAGSNFQSQAAFLESCINYSSNELNLAAVVFSPIVEEGWDKILAALQKAERPVVVVGNPIAVDDSLYDVYIHPDWRGQGGQAADWLIKNVTTKQQKVVELRVQDGTSVPEKIHTGFQEGIAQTDWQIVEDREVMDSRIEAMHHMMDILAPDYDRFRDKEKPAPETLTNVDIVFAHTDDIALGAIEALRELGLEPGKDVRVVSIGGSKAALAAIMDGHLAASVENDPLYGDTLISVTNQLNTKKAWGEKEVLLLGAVFDQKNASKNYANRLY